MSNLAIRNDQELIKYDVWNSQVNQIKKIYGKTLTEGEWETFLNVGKATGLNPFLREIWAVKYGNNPAQIFVGRDGYRRSAQANPEYDYHHVDAIYTNDDFNFDLVKGEVVHTYHLKDRGDLLGAYSLVKKRNSTKPVFVFVELKEYDKKQSNWKSMPATMIKKVAESQALRMAFQELFGGTYHESEEWREPNKFINNEPIRTIDANAISTSVEDEGFKEFEYLKTDISKIRSCQTHEDLKEAFTAATKFWQKRKDMEAIKQIIIAKDERKGEIDVIEYNKEIEAAEKNDEQ